MIKIEQSPLTAEIFNYETCCMIIVHNFEKLPKDIIMDIYQESFIVNCFTWYPDLVCVIPHNEKQDKIWEKLVNICTITKVQNWRKI